MHQIIPVIRSAIYDELFEFFGNAADKTTGKHFCHGMDCDSCKLYKRPLLMEDKTCLVNRTMELLDILETNKKEAAIDGQ